MNTLKKCLPDAIVVALFAVISFAYFLVPVSQGKILFRHDSQAGVGMGQELTEYEQRTGEVTRWTNSLFSGMPTYQISPAYSSTDGLSAVMAAYHLWLPDYVWFLFAYLLGFYILLRRVAAAYFALRDWLLPLPLRSDSTEHLRHPWHLAQAASWFRLLRSSIV